jgi:membrane-bound metal-dependent hydrolase YbcI (DUF457 family)
VPSPIGHALGALTVGWAATPRPASTRAAWTQSLIFIAVGVAPDLDLLIGRHRQEFHSLGAAVVLASTAVIMRWPVANTRWRTWVAIFLACLSHPLLDALGTDNAAPFGIMAAWPVSRSYFLTGWDVFLPIPRRWDQAGFLWLITRAATREVLLLAPLAAATWVLRRRRRQPAYS